eukprot:CAMPEP_0170170428 /NCGR_PEP_ID=MMETSP0040_2-20121228/3427_1 /TAXON_ID=641309 /ORGANISM="Lotharella oceanica, Strain CCMP622" /LENGTH=51 /DNA_ID=CAMNT_0010409833 /DNA_START=680 /DNA_END=831 /DNA_ORIENTATION=+
MSPTVPGLHRTASPFDDPALAWTKRARSLLAGSRARASGVSARRLESSSAA